MPSQVQRRNSTRSTPSRIRQASTPAPDRNPVQVQSSNRVRLAAVPAPDPAMNATPVEVTRPLPSNVTPRIDSPSDVAGISANLVGTLLPILRQVEIGRASCRERV